MRLHTKTFVSHPDRRCSRTLYGFTLIETLMCMAVLAILALILLPAIQRVRGNARQTTCASNLRQVHSGVMRYVLENDGRFPDVNVRLVDEDGNPGPYKSWWQHIAPYVGGPDSSSSIPVHKILQCPEVAMLGNELMTRADRMRLPNYGMNNHLGRVSNGAGVITAGGTVRVTDVEEPSQTLLVGDNGMGKTAPQAELSPTKVTWQGDKHADGSNFLWVDGHVSIWKNVTSLADDPYKPGGSDDVWNP